MSQHTGVTLCSGGGGSALGLLAAGVQPVGAVEYDAAIAAHYATQLGPHVTIAPVQAVDYRQWAGVDVLQASPPCPSFSVAKQGGAEGPLDLAIAEAICRALREIRPRTFWLENVEGYANSQSYGLIRAALDNLDYWSHAAVVNSADVGVPQTRRRLILRAVSGGWMQPFRPLPASVPWVGWFAAIADLLDTLPASRFAPWQLKRLPVELGSFLHSAHNADGTTEPRPPQMPAFSVQATEYKNMPRAFVLSNAQTAWGDGLRTADEPMLSVTGQTAGRVRAFVVDQTNGSRDSTIRYADEPIWTIPAAYGVKHPPPRAFIVEGQPGDNGRYLNVRGADCPVWTISASQDRKPARAWLECGRVVKMTPRALARFQAFPDSYALPDNNALACRVLGNAVPPLLAQRITESLL